MLRMAHDTLATVGSAQLQPLASRCLPAMGHASCCYRQDTMKRLILLDGHTTSTLRSIHAQAQSKEVNCKE
jgi:hypothetical protein